MVDYTSLSGTSYFSISKPRHMKWYIAIDYAMQTRDLKDCVRNNFSPVHARPWSEGHGPELQSLYRRV
jgi:hypothetical protein